MIHLSATLSLVPQAKGGPFLFWDDFPGHCALIAALGFHGVELFASDAATVEKLDISGVLGRHGLRLAALGTGAGWVLQRLHLCHPQAAQRQAALQFIESMIDVASRFSAPVIIGSMQGRHEPELERGQALQWLRESLSQLADRAAAKGVKLLYEPLNRYETNLFNRLEEAAEFVRPLCKPNLLLLADLFHMNIEETSIAAAIGKAGPLIGHVHWVDSNRRAAGFGHLELDPIAQALREINYSGFVSAEVLPYPTSEAAARQSALNYGQLFPNS